MRGSRLRLFALVAVLWHGLSSDVAFAQAAGSRFEVGGQIVTTTLRQFDGSDVGVGGRVGWRPTGMFGLEAEFNVFPRNFPERVPFSGARIEGLFGATWGPTFGRSRVFGRLRPGVVVFREAPGPIACITIFPPPLSCTLAAGDTLFAIDAGGGVEVSVTPMSFVRVDAGDRMVKYPGPTFDLNRAVRSDGFFGHDFRFAVGGGLRF